MQRVVVRRDRWRRVLPASLTAAVLAAAPSAARAGLAGAAPAGPTSEAVAPAVMMPVPGGETRPEQALVALLAETRVGLNLACPDRDRLARILCSGRIRIGVRTNYLQFGQRTGDGLQGFEIELARRVAAALGTTVDLVPVTPANRIPLLAEGRIDLVIATLGHNTQRGAQAHFVLPHYYQSETVLVGPRALKLAGWEGVAGRTLCVTVGNGSNAGLAARGARLMLFDSPGQLLDQLQSGACSLVAQDDSFFAAAFATPAFAAAFERKLGFAPLPWGMAVARDGPDAARLARAAGLLLQAMHRDGQLIGLAAGSRVATGFLEAQQAVWSRPDCNTAAPAPGCMLAPLNSELRATRYATEVDAVEAWAGRVLGLRLSLPMLTSAAAWTLLCNGVVNALVLVAGTLAATLACALGFALLHGTRLLRGPAWLLTTILQSSPVILALVAAAGIANAVLAYSPAVALGTAIVTLGLINGAHAGQAIAEAAATLSAGPRRLRRALGRSGRQIDSFLVNAAKGTPAASFIGAPELLNALTDISSVSSERISTYTLLLFFYTAVVMAVVALCTWLRGMAEGRRAA